MISYKHFYFLFLLLIFLPLFPSISYAATVNSGGLINSAIQAAQSGETITVQPGTYREQVTITKPITLIGSSGVWIDGECSRATGITI